MAKLITRTLTTTNVKALFANLETKEITTEVVVCPTTFKDADKALKYAFNLVKSKQQCWGFSAAYGFGAYLFEKHKTEYKDMIAGYANISRLLDSCERRWIEFKYMLYPKYPSSPIIENLLYERLMEML